MFLYFSLLLPLIISLTLGQSNLQTQPFIINYSSRQAKLFDSQSINDNPYYFNHNNAFQSSVIESRSSTDHHNLSDDSSSGQFNAQTNPHASLVLNKDDKSNEKQNEKKDEQSLLKYSVNQNNNQNNNQNSNQNNNQNNQNNNQNNQNNNQNNQHISFSIYQNPNSNPTYHSSNFNNQLINKNNENEHHLFNYELDQTIYHHQQANHQHVNHQQVNNLHSRLTTTYSTTPVPILRLKNTKNKDGKLSPTLIITLPKKRKSNGKSRRFPFLKAIVSSFISTDRRTTSSPSSAKANNDQQQNNQISKLDLANSNTQNEYTNHNNFQNRNQQIYSNNVQALSQSMRSQSMVAPNAEINSNQNTNNNQNSDNSLSSATNQPKEDIKLSNEFESDNFQVPPTKDELPEDDEEDEPEFNEFSEAPRPHNFDDNQYYIESNKIKYSSAGREPIKQTDHLGQAQYSINQQTNQKQPNTYKYSSSNTSPDFESMTSEVIDQEENDNSDKRPSISVRSRGSFLIGVLSKMMKSVNFTMITEDMRLGSSSRASCLACHALAALYLSPFYSKDAMVNAARTICISFRLQPPRVCAGLIDSFKDDLDYIRTHTKLNRREMCGVIFGLKCSRITTNNLNWMISIPHRPNMIERRMMKQHNLNSINLDGSESGSVSNYTLYHHQNTNQASNPKNYNLVSSTSTSNSVNAANLLDIVQITDIHVDPYYVPGSSAECGEPLCCRATSGPAKGASKIAGVWGDYRNCDTPVNTLRNTLKQISDNHPHAKYWMWTGDIAPHDIWNITKGEIVYQLRLVSNMIKEYSKVPVFPVIGNHEGVPVNSFPPPEVKGDLSVSWLYDEVAKQWSYWLPPEAIKTLRFGGYYSVKVKPGFRIISLNTNYCTRLNPWTLYDPVDPGNQLKWLVKELHNAELANDKVHILGHIPPDNRECTQAWLNNFLRIIDRFEHVVLAQYYGHTHRDEFRVLYSPYGHGLKPINVAYIGPSVTPFTENNPAYRIYSMNDKGYIQNHHTYYFNLTEANELGVPIWRHEYSATQAFPLKNLGPEGWHELISKFMEDNRLLNKYHKMYFRYSQSRYNQICLGKCRQALLNDLIVAHPLRTKPRRLFGSRKNN